MSTASHSRGYVRVKVPGHPLAMSDGYVLEHRYVLYEAGVDVPEGLQVHHRNGNRADNRLENLEVVTPREHGLLHRTTRRTRPCESCGIAFVPWKWYTRFCSTTCSNGGRNAPAKCQHCGIDYVARGATSRYCTTRCTNAAFRARRQAMA